MPQFDLVTFGAGLSGLVTACRASQLGLKVAVLEQETSDRHPCSSRYSTGVGNVAGAPINRPFDEVADAIDHASGGHAKPELVEAFAANANRAYEWLRSEGVKFVRQPHNLPERRSMVLAPPRRFKYGLDWEGRGGDVTLQKLEANLKSRDGEVHRGVRVTSLIAAADACGACVGLNAEQNGQPIRYDATAVVVADGGFMANPAMIARHIAPAADRILARCAPNVQGDGMWAAEAIGAEIAGLGEFYGHLQHRDAMTNDKLWPYPTFDAIAQAAIMVDGAGNRFTDEGRGGVPIANAVAQLADPLSTTLIFDADIWRTAGRIGPVGADPHLVYGGGDKYEAATPAELAAMAGVPADALAATVDAYNAAHASGRLADLDPPRTTDIFDASPIMTPPYYAIPLCAGITGTMGGLSIDPNARVLTPAGTAIDGLYAVGTSTGGLEGGPRVAYMGGLSKAYIWGLLAAEHAAEYAKQSS